MDHGHETFLILQYFPHTNWPSLRWGPETCIMEKYIIYFYSIYVKNFTDTALEYKTS